MQKWVPQDTDIMLSQIAEVMGDLSAMQSAILVMNPVTLLRAVTDAKQEMEDIQMRAIELGGL